MMAGLTQNYVTPYALTMNATTQQVGLLASIPNFAMAITQLFSPAVSERMGSRKRLVVFMAIMHALMWLPVILIPYLFQNNRVWWLIAFITLGTAFNSVSQPAWGSMMADLVPQELRGRYFGGRNRIAGFIGLVFSFIAGGILQAFTRNTNLGFSIIFAGALVSRLVSSYYLIQMNEPWSPAIDGKTHTGLAQIYRGLFSSNIGRFIIFAGLIQFSTALAGPFFAPYMLRELKFNYITYTFVNAASAVTTIGFMTYWGRRSDRAGNIRITRISSMIIPFIPILWLVSRNVYWITFVEVIAGFAWAGFQLATGLFIYDASPPETRTRHIAIFNSMIYIGASLGALTGGVVAPHLPKTLGSYFLSIFIISGLARLATVLFFIPRIKEVRDITAIRARELMIPDIRPSDLRAYFDEVWEILKKVFKIFPGRK